MIVSPMKVPVNRHKVEWKGNSSFLFGRRLVWIMSTVLHHESPQDAAAAPRPPMKRSIVLRRCRLSHYPAERLVKVGCGDILFNVS